MGKIVYATDANVQELPALVEGYLYALGEVCYGLFGTRGEQMAYQMIGSYFCRYLEKHLGIQFTKTDPWERYCEIVAAFTKYGFYPYAELEQKGENSYWMLEAGHRAGRIQEETKAWTRGTPPSPLWSVVVYSLSTLERAVVIDSATYNENMNAVETTFHFEAAAPQNAAAEPAPVPATAAGENLHVCALCKKYQTEDGWHNIETLLINQGNTIKHTLCPECEMRLYTAENDKK